MLSAKLLTTSLELPLVLSEGGSAFERQQRKSCELLALVDDSSDETEKLGVNGIKSKI